MEEVEMIDFARWTGTESFVLAPPGQEAPNLETILPAHAWIATSGSSQGAGKWVALSREALFSSAAAVNRHLQSDASDIWLNVLPTFHVGGLGVFARAHQSGGQAIDHSHRKWIAEEFWAELQRVHATLSSLVPTQVYDLVKAQLLAPPTLRAVVVGGGALAGNLYRAARDLKWPLLPSYGLTECSSQVATASLDSLSRAEFPDYVILDHVEVRVDADQVLALKSPALLTAYAQEISGKWTLVDPKRDGWFESEDRAQIEGRRLKPLGRKDRRIKILGELVDVALLEELLANLSLGKELEAVLLTTPEERRGWRIDIVATGDLRACESLFEMFYNQVPSYARPAGLYVVEQLPKSPLGKVLIPSLRNRLNYSAIDSR